ASETRFELISRHVGLAGPTNGSRVGKTYFPDLIDHRQVSLTESLLLMKRTMAPSSKLEILIPGCGAEHNVYSIYYTIQHTLYHGQFSCKNVGVRRMSATYAVRGARRSLGRKSSESSWRRAK